jgi:hypothetical protein
MPRPKSEPSYCIHKRSGRAYVTIDGRQIPLGPANSSESRVAFDCVRAAWLSNGRRLPDNFDIRTVAPSTHPTTAIPTSTAGTQNGPAVAYLLEAFWTHAQEYYTTTTIGHDGAVRGESADLDNYRQVIRLLRRLYGQSQTAAFGCPELEALRNVMIAPRTDPKTGEQRPGWCRTNTNRQVGRVCP